MDSDKSTMGTGISLHGSNTTSGATSKLEYAVQMHCNNCVQQIMSQLEGVPGVYDVAVDLASGSVVVETSLPSSAIEQKIQKAGKEAILRGIGGVGNKNLGAAVAILGGVDGFSKCKVQGVVRLTQVDERTCIIDGTIDGLAPGKHGLHVHECGDISNGCESVGEHFNPHNASHGSPDNDVTKRHVGDLGNINADKDGRAVFRLSDNLLKVWDVIGRSVVVTESADDFGFGLDSSSKVDGNSGDRLACGIIARSAGLFENSKKICACDGLTLWDERNKPAAGSSRQQSNSSRL